MSMSGGLLASQAAGITPAQDCCPPAMRDITRVLQCEEQGVDDGRSVNVFMSEEGLIFVLEIGDGTRRVETRE